MKINLDLLSGNDEKNKLCNRKLLCEIQLIRKIAELRTNNICELTHEMFGT